METRLLGQLLNIFWTLLWFSSSLKIIFYNAETLHCLWLCHRSDKPASSGLSWHSLPTNNKKFLRTWLIKIKRQNTPVTKNSFLCSNHFNPECFRKSWGNRKALLKPGFIPTIFSFSQKPSRKAPLDRSQYGKCTPVQQCGSSAALEQNELLPLGNNEKSNTTKETLFYE